MRAQGKFTVVSDPEFKSDPSSDEWVAVVPGSPEAVAAEETAKLLAKFAEF